MQNKPTDLSDLQLKHVFQTEPHGKWSSTRHGVSSCAIATRICEKHSEKARAAHSAGRLFLSNKSGLIPETDIQDVGADAGEHGDDEPKDVVLCCDDEECTDVTNTPEDVVVHIDEPPSIKEPPKIIETAHQS